MSDYGNNGRTQEVRLFVQKLEIMIIKQLLLGNLVTDECITDYDNKERVDNE